MNTLSAAHRAELERILDILDQGPETPFLGDHYAKLAQIIRESTSELTTTEGDLGERPFSEFIRWGLSLTDT